MVLIKQGKNSITRFDDNFSQLVAKITQLETSSSSSSFDKKYFETNDYSYSQFSFQLTSEENNLRSANIQTEAKDNEGEINIQDSLVFNSELQSNNEKGSSGEIN